MSETNFDFDLLGEIALEAPQEGGLDFNQVNFGRAYGSHYQAVSYDQDAKQYKKREYTFGKPLNKGEHLEFRLHHEVEKKDGSTYERMWFVKVMQSGKSKSVWATQIQPSIVSTFGVGKPSKEKEVELKRVTKAIGSFFSAIHNKGSYMEIEYFKTGEFQLDKNGVVDANTGEIKQYPVTVPVIKAVFKSKAESDAARQSRFSKKQEADLSFGDDGKIPSDVVNTVKAFIGSIGEEQAKENLANQAPFNLYNWDELVKAAS